MWLLPFATLTFSSQAEADEVLASIKEHSVPSEVINLPTKGKHYFSSFLGHRITLQENSFFFMCPCVVTGDVVSFGFETTIKTVIRPGWFFLLLLLGFAVIEIIVLGLVYLAYTHPANNDMPRILYQIAPWFLYAFLLGIFRWKVMKHRRQLMIVLKADKVR